MWLEPELSRLRSFVPGVAFINLISNISASLVLLRLYEVVLVGDDYDGDNSEIEPRNLWQGLFIALSAKCSALKEVEFPFGFLQSNSTPLNNAVFHYEHHCRPDFYEYVRNAPHRNCHPRYGLRQENGIIRIQLSYKGCNVREILKKESAQLVGFDPWEMLFDDYTREFHPRPVEYLERTFDSETSDSSDTESSASSDD